VRGSRSPLGIGGRRNVGRALAHVSSLRVLKSSVKVVRHKGWNSFCGRLWKKAVGGAGKSRLSSVSQTGSGNPRSNGRLKSVDEWTDHVVSEILGGRPRNIIARDRPDTNGGLVPIGVGFKERKGTAPIAYIFPSRHKKLEDKMPDHIGKCEPLEASRRPVVDGLDMAEKASSAISSLPLKGAKPNLRHGWNGERLPEVLANRAREKRSVIVGVRVVNCSGL
jgi:hypothetical protein